LDVAWQTHYVVPDDCNVRTISDAEETPLQHFRNLYHTYK